MKELDEFLELSGDILKSVKELMIKKNHDYAAADDVFRNINTMAEMVKLLRLDLTRPTHLVLHEIVAKVHRLVNLESKEGNVMNEPVLDSVQDIIVFALLYYGMWR